MVDLAAPFLASLLLGSLYTMMALGLTITYKVSRIPNFAHAELVTVGSYAGVVAVNTWGRGLGRPSSSPSFPPPPSPSPRTISSSGPSSRGAPPRSTCSSPRLAWAS